MEATRGKDPPSFDVQPGMTQSAVVAQPIAVGRAWGPEEFVEMVRAHDAPLRALAFRMLGDRTLMDDALQEAYLKAFRAQESYRGDASLGTWLYRITYNVCLDLLRSAARRPVEPLETAYGVTSTVADPGDVATSRADLAAALATLPPDQRAAVLLVDADGLDYAAAGQVLGVAAGTVGSRVSRGRAALRAVLTTGDVT